jgi:hypothetical protein
LRRGEDVAGECDADARVAQHLDRAIRRTVALEDQGDAPTVGRPPLHVVDDPPTVAVIERDGLGRQRQRATLVRRHVGQRVQLAFEPRSVFERGRPRLLRHPERRRRPPRHAEVRSGRAHVGQARERGRAGVHGRPATAGGRGPARFQELNTGTDEVMRPRPDPFRVAQQHMRADRHAVDQQLDAVTAVQQGRGQRLHALDRNAFGELIEDLDEFRMLRGQLGRALAHVRCEEQLATGRRPQPLDLVDGALVGDRERTDLLDLVAPELDAHRVLVGRREYVQQAAADGEFASLRHQVNAGIRQLGQLADHVVEVGARPSRKLDRFEIAEPLELRLEYRAHGRDHDADRPPGRVVEIGVREPTQDAEPPADRVRARRQPLVRQRLPRRVDSDLVGRQQVAEGRGQILGLAGRRGDREDRATGAAQAGRLRADAGTEARVRQITPTGGRLVAAGDRGDHERPQSWWCRDVDLLRRRAAATREAGHRGERLVIECRRQ